MKKRHFIYFILLCLIATSCENTVLEEEIPAKSVTTKSSVNPDVFREFNTVFYNIIPIYGGGNGITRMSGDVSTYKEGVEYNFTLWCEIKGDVKCVLWAATGNVEFIYNGISYSSIYAENKKAMKIKVKFHSTKTTFFLALETNYTPTLYKEGYARFVFDNASYNGEWMGAAGFVPGGSHDLTVNARYWDSQGATEYHWTCVSCGTINADYNSTCIGCGK